MLKTSRIIFTHFLITKVNSKVMKTYKENIGASIQTTHGALQTLIFIHYNDDYNDAGGGGTEKYVYIVVSFYYSIQYILKVFVLCSFFLLF